MSSRGKTKTTYAKLAREGRLRERRMEKAARKEARRLNPELYDPYAPVDLGDETDPDAVDGDTETADAEADTARVASDTRGDVS